MFRIVKLAASVAGALLIATSTGSIALAVPAGESSDSSSVSKSENALRDSSNLVSVQNNNSDQIWAEVQKYLVGTGDQQTFDMDAAKAAGASEDVLAVGKAYNQWRQTKTGNKDRSFQLALWGNWCGPGYSGQNGGPVDQLDTACMRHDLCYEAQGYFSCDCDQKLIDEINDRWDRMQPREKIMAVAVKGFFTLGKKACTHYPQVQKEPFRLEIKQNAWVVARYEISWDQQVNQPNGSVKLEHKTWSANNHDRTINGIDHIDLPTNAKNLKVKIITNTGLAWYPWKTVFESNNLELVKHRVIELKGTTVRIWVLNNQI